MLQNDIFKGRYSTYQLQDVIGKGGSAVVYSAIDKITQKTVAIKRMIAADESTLHRWRIEVEALISLREQGTSSQFVVAYLDHMQAGKTIMLVEEYAPNGSLLSLLRRRENHGHGLKEGQVMAYMYQVTRGLAYIHGKRIVHRDLKCANVLLFDDGQLLKLSDFGLAAGGPPPQSRTAADAEVEGGLGENKAAEEEGVLGSVYWMAPEIARGDPHSTRSDVWSLGCLCVELLTGRPPFFEREPVHALFCIAEGTDSAIPQGLFLSDDCRSFLEACLSTDPQQRTSAAQLVQHRWFSELRIDTRLAELAARSRSGGSRDPSAAATGYESVPGAVSPGLLSTSGSTREPWSPSASFTHGHSGATSPPAPTSVPMGSPAATGHVTQAFPDDGDGLGQVVEHALFSKPAAQCEQWLESHGLTHVLDSLDQAIPGEAYNVLRIIAFAAKSREAKHRQVPNCLGETNLWQQSTLLQPTTRSDLADIFCCCCERQSAEVCHYTPADCQALHFLLHTGDPDSAEDNNRTADASALKAAHSAIQALHTLFVIEPLPLVPPSPPPNAALPEGAVAGVATAAGEAMAAMEPGAAHRLQAVRLFVLGGGFEVVRRVLERQCERSLRTTADPVLGWPAVSQLMQILAAVEAHASPLSACPSSSSSAAAAAVGSLSSLAAPDTLSSGDAAFVAATACRLMWGSHIAVSLYGPQALGAAAASAVGVGGSAGLAGLMATAGTSPPRTPHAPLSPSAASLVGPSAGEGTAPSSPHTMEPVIADGVSGVSGVSGGGGARSESGLPAARHPADPGYQAAVEGVMGRAGASPTVRWFIGLQHASRSHQCRPAVPLLLRYGELSVQTLAPDLEAIGRWLGRSVLLLASYAHEEPAARLAALDVLAGLAQTSASARGALRDTVVVVPMLAALVRQPPRMDGGQQKVLQFVQAVCLIDGPFAALALGAGSPLIAALVAVLHSALALGGLGDAEPTDLDDASADARAAQLAEEAAAHGRHPFEEVTVALALVSQAISLAAPSSSSAGGGTGGGGSPEGSSAARLADPAVLGVLANDLEAVRQRLPADNGMAEVLRGQVQSMLEELVTDMNLTA